MPREGGEACALAELVQFHCQLQHHRILCQPVERVFRMCPRRPAVEVTQLVEYDEHNKPYLPEAFADYTPHTHTWDGRPRADARDVKDE
ncbi:uncharacterized protein MJAP1_002738 [Malassezia japonica]|uniref:Uncharacterized protein n=1 Tax=Malassezia japonica TaxID=223818 RepID=A0AAF0F7J7_9BASI|nr:uncharacterized protein MJAP1_002738 [Malassezia japonica]WFD39757.1 hypothetical protein MJAP1_002738 [Malassezia japonica]